MITLLFVPSSVGTVPTETQLVVFRSVFCWRRRTLSGGPNDGDGVGSGVDDLKRRSTGGLNRRDEAPEAALDGVATTGEGVGGGLADGAADGVLLVGAGATTTGDGVPVEGELIG